ncbi:MAG: hypothetical protein JSS66_16685 [Armatimonadetes bacterium]|nr:hypothetical protein [Armatimonadota bacterium]
MFLHPTHSGRELRIQVASVMADCSGVSPPSLHAYLWDGLGNFLDRAPIGVDRRATLRSEVRDQTCEFRVAIGPLLAGEECTLPNLVSRGAIFKKVPYQFEIRPVVVFELHDQEFQRWTPKQDEPRTPRMART